MGRINRCLMVMPPVYEIEFGQWRWCKLHEVCSVVAGLRKITETDFDPTPEELVSRFAALAKRNGGLKGPGVSEEDGARWMKKIFRYSRDGVNFWGTEVPTTYPVAPPYVFFQLDLATPYPQELFVPEGWVIDTLKAVRLGAVAAADFDGRKIGFAPEKSYEPFRLIPLDGNNETILARMPECVLKLNR